MKFNKKKNLFILEAILYILITSSSFVYAYEGKYDFKFWIGFTVVAAGALKAKLSGGKESLYEINAETGVLKKNDTEDKKEGEE